MSGVTVLRLRAGHGFVRSRLARAHGGATFATFVPKWGNQFRAETQRTQRRVRGGCRDYPGLMRAEGWRWAQGQR